MRVKSPLTVSGMARQSRRVTTRTQRRAECAFIREITHVTYGADATDVAVPDGGWDLVLMTRSGNPPVLHAGSLTKPVDLGYAPGDEYLAISFRPFENAESLVLRSCAPTRLPRRCGMVPGNRSNLHAAARRILANEVRLSPARSPPEHVAALHVQRERRRDAFRPCSRPGTEPYTPAAAWLARFS